MKNEQTHTPGPWYDGKMATNSDQGIVASEITGESIAVIYDKKNLPLIAAAPELLEALKLLADYAERVSADICDQDTGWFYQFGAATDKANNAIRKAKAE